MDMAASYLANLRNRLASQIGAQYVVDGSEIEPRYLSDWTAVRRGNPALLLRPRTPSEVSDVLKLCNESDARVVVQGGLTGLAEGAVPGEGEVILSLERMNTIEEIDTLAGTMVVQAGVPLERIHEAAEARDWFFPLDLGARGSCQIGGNAATNAGGNRVLRFGMARELILGLEVALANGTRLPMMNRLIKNNTGYDLKHLFIGSEGTLGVITRLVLKLEPRPRSRCTALCAVNSFDSVARLLREARSSLSGQLAAFEVMWDDYYEYALAKIPKLSRPFGVRHSLYALIETFGADQERDQERFSSFLESVLETDLVRDAVVCQSLQQAEELWRLRDAIGELLPQIEPYLALDVGIPLSSMGLFVNKVREYVTTSYRATNLTFGHLGDGNLHLATGPYPETEVLKTVERFIYEAVRSVGGSVSAEHGIGLHKKPYLSHTRTTGEIETMRMLKRALDPKNTLNAGRIFDLG